MCVGILHIKSITLSPKTGVVFYFEIFCLRIIYNIYTICVGIHTLYIEHYLDKLYNNSHIIGYA